MALLTAAADALALAGVQAEVLSAGAGDRAVVALHGFAGDPLDFTAIAPALAEQTGPWVGLRPWHGLAAAAVEGSERDAPASLVQRAHAVWAAVAALQPREVVLVGYSMGARLGLTALLHPELASARDTLRLAGAVLVGATAGLDDASARDARARDDAALAQRIEARGMAWFVDHWGDVPLLRSQRQAPPELRAAMAARRLRLDAADLAMCLRAAGTGAMTPLWNELAELHVPTLVLHGEQDERYAALAQRIVAAAPAGVVQASAIPGAGHAPQIERPTLTAEAIAAWLATIGWGRGVAPRPAASAPPVERADAPADAPRPAPYEIEVPVRFHQVDAAGILFYAQAFVLAHDAYEGFVRDVLGRSFAAHFEAREVVTPIRSASADYRRPVRAGTTLRIAVEVERVGESSFTLRYSASSDAGLHFVVTLVHATLDVRTGRKAALPPELRARLTG